MDQASKLAPRVVKAHGACFATSEAQLDEGAGRVLLPESWGVSCPVETPTKEAAEARTGALRREINVNLPLSLGKEVRLFGVQEHKLELLAGVSP